MFIKDVDFKRKMKLDTKLNMAPEIRKQIGIANNKH